MDRLLSVAFESPVWGMTLTLGAYIIGVIVQQKTKIMALQPILTASLLIILFLKATGQNYEAYSDQNVFLAYILSLSAVVLAVPAYRNLDILKKFWKPIFLGITAGSAATIITAILVGKAMGTELSILISLIPKSCTTPIAYGVSESLGGVPAFTVAMVVLTGISGAVFGPALLHLLKVDHEIARGLTLGTISHAIGTTRAFTEGEICGSMSSLAMALAGMITAFLAPVFAAIFF